jgi:hypothetical protein
MFWSILIEDFDDIRLIVFQKCRWRYSQTRLLLGRALVVLCPEDNNSQLDHGGLARRRFDVSSFANNLIHVKCRDLKMIGIPQK